MDKKQIHELAIAYAQARLIRKQQDAETPPTEDELYIFAYDYQFALERAEKMLRQYPKL